MAGIVIEDHFAARLRELREAAGMSQKALASEVGVDTFTVSRWETRSKSPGWTSVLSVCRALGVAPDAFVIPPGKGVD